MIAYHEFSIAIYSVFKHHTCSFEKCNTYVLREFHLLRFDQQIIHKTFAELTGRLTHTLNNFSIADIDIKTIKVNEQALTLITASNGERMKY